MKSFTLLSRTTCHVALATTRIKLRAQNFNLQLCRFNHTKNNFFSTSNSHVTETRLKGPRERVNGRCKTDSLRFRAEQARKKIRSIGRRSEKRRR